MREGGTFYDGVSSPQRSSFVSLPQVHSCYPGIRPSIMSVKSRRSLLTRRKMQSDSQFNIWYGYLACFLMFAPALDYNSFDLDTFSWLCSGIPKICALATDFLLSKDFGFVPAVSFAPSLSSGWLLLLIGLSPGVSYVLSASWTAKKPPVRSPFPCLTPLSVFITP